MADFWRFAIAVFWQWWTVTLGILTLLGIVDYFLGWKIGLSNFLRAGVALLFVGCFLAWREEHQRAGGTGVAELKQLQDQVATLHAALAPRRLTPERRQALRSAVGRLGPQRMQIVSQSGEPESMRYRDDFAEVFVDAGWTVERTKGYFMTPVFGIYLVAHEDKQDAADALAAEFGALGFELKRQSTNLGEPSLVLVVGEKPN